MNMTDAVKKELDGIRRMKGKPAEKPVKDVLILVEFVDGTIHLRHPPIFDTMKMLKKLLEEIAIR